MIDVVSRLNVCYKQIAELGIYPAVDPLDSTSRLLDPEYISYEHYKACRDTQKLLQDYKSLQDIIAILGKWKAQARYSIQMGCALAVGHLSCWVYC